MTHFIVTFDRRDATSEATPFEDPFEALRQFSARSRELIDDEDIEVVLLAADDLDDLRKTHPNFFAEGDLLLPA